MAGVNDRASEKNRTISTATVQKAFAEGHGDTIRKTVKRRVEHKKKIKRILSGERGVLSSGPASVLDGILLLDTQQNSLQVQADRDLRRRRQEQKKNQ